MRIYHNLTFERGSGFDWGKFIVMFLDNLFTACFLLHLALLSLERLHATLFPLRHCLMLVWVYFKAVVCIWLLAVIPASAAATFFLITPQGSKYVWASLIIAVLFTVIVSYVMIIALNVKRKVRPYSFGAVPPERKLTVTLSVVIALSSLAFLPWFFRCCPWNKHKIERFIRWGPVWYPGVVHRLLLRQLLCKSVSLYLKNEGV